ncbi:DUF6985 domain-containing protein [Shewanella baltica]|uniref:DUF6985 domain-containing protein n=1 Tax=Shewanella baltica TaxID=62322 RepID=UPI003D29BC7E
MNHLVCFKFVKKSCSLVLKVSVSIGWPNTEPGVFIFPEDEGGETHIEYECTFDIEHGLRVIFKNGRLIKVGLE